jgi:hypothetical protein
MPERTGTVSQSTPKSSAGLVIAATLLLATVFSVFQAIKTKRFHGDLTGVSDIRAFR